MISKKELEALSNYWSERSINGPTAQSRRYADGYVNALNLIWKTLHSGTGFSLKEWVEMEGPDGIKWEEEVN